MKVKKFKARLVVMVYSQMNSNEFWKRNDGDIDRDKFQKGQRSPKQDKSSQVQKGVSRWPKGPRITIGPELARQTTVQSASKLPARTTGSEKFQNGPRGLEKSSKDA